MTRDKRQETKMEEKRQKRQEGKWIKSKHQDNDDDDDDDNGRMDGRMDNDDGRTDGLLDPKGVDQWLQSQWQRGIVEGWIGQKKNKGGKITRFTDNFHLFRRNWTFLFGHFCLDIFVWT